MPFSDSQMVALSSDLSISPICTAHSFRCRDASQRSVCSEVWFSRKKDDLPSLLGPSPGLELGLGFLCKRARPTLRLQPLAALNAAEYRKLHALEKQGKNDEEDDDLCPVECVREFKTSAELVEVLEAAKESNALVVVDFYKTACGSCKYIEQGFIKLCKGAGDDEAAVVFLKHNVMDEYEEQSEVAEELKIKVVPLFHFYKNGQLLESFPTREKTKILETIQKYLSSIPNDSEDKP
eukprot:c17865_g1_i1 orf=136-846(+)